MGAEPPTPTVEDLLLGRLGDGTREAITPELQRAYQMRKREKQRELKRAREQGFEDANKDMLIRAAKVRDQALRIGEAVADKILRGEEVTQVEAQLWKKALDEAKRAEERVLGKAVAKTENHQSGGFLGLIINKDAK